jgi:hypothetical protein
MDYNTGKPNHIEDFLIRLHTGQWFGWSDSKNKIYSNLIIHDNSKTKPTEQECINGLAKLQSEYNSKQYQRDRAKDYPSMQEQLDMQYWVKINGTNKWQQAINAVKQKYPK